MEAFGSDILGSFLYLKIASNKRKIYNDNCILSLAELPNFAVNQKTIACIASLAESEIKKKEPNFSTDVAMQPVETDESQAKMERTFS